LSRLTGDERYQRAAHDALLDFLRITQNPDTGLVAWGEHLWWDCFNDCPGEFYGGKKIHEPKRKLVFFDLLYKDEPERTLRYARGVWEHQIADHKTGDFSRHAAYDKHAPGRGYDFPKEGSYFIDLWSRAYEKSSDPVFTNAITVLASRYRQRMSDCNLLDFDTSKDPERDNMCVALWLISLAMESDAAAGRVDRETAMRLKDLALWNDKGFLSLEHDFEDASHGFICYAYTDSGKVRPRAEKKSDGYARHWGMGYGINTTSMFGLLSYGRQAQLGSDKRAETYRRMVVKAADIYGQAKADPKADDIWAGEYGMAIFVELAALRLTGESRYLEAARRIADEAVAVLWDGGAVLPRASTQTTYYDCVSYPDTLLLSLLALHEHVAGLEPNVPISDLNR
jgi:hypothetical protein